MVKRDNCKVRSLSLVNALRKKLHKRGIGVDNELHNAMDRIDYLAFAKSLQMPTCRIMDLNVADNGLGVEGGQTFGQVVEFNHRCAAASSKREVVSGRWSVISEVSGQ